MLDNWYQAQSNYINEYFDRFGEPPFTVNNSSGCWLWSRGTNGVGYGVAVVNSKQELAHRVVFEIYKGKIADGLTLDHLCRVPLCVNPDHLEAVTHRENVLRGKAVTALNAKKKYCKHGHELREENVYRSGTNKRRCKLCTSRLAKIYYMKHKDKWSNYKRSNKC